MQIYRRIGVISAIIADITKLVDIPLVKLVKEGNYGYTK